MKFTYLIIGLAALVSTGCSGVRQFGHIETPQGTERYFSIRDRGIIFGSNNTITAVRHADGSIEYIHSSNNPGLASSLVNAGGHAGAAALLRPARSNTSVNASGANGTNVSSGSSSAAQNSATNNSSSTSNGGDGFVPPGHQGTNPGNGH